MLSLNRFEQKKNVALAIDAFALLREKSVAGSSKNIRLVLAGKLSAYPSFASLSIG